MLNTLPGDSKQGYIHQNCIISGSYLAYQYQRHFQFLTLFLHSHSLHSVWQLNPAFASEHYFNDYFLLLFLFVCLFFLLGTHKIFRLLVASSLCSYHSLFPALESQIYLVSLWPTFWDGVGQGVQLKIISLQSYFYIPCVLICDISGGVYRN